MRIQILDRRVRCARLLCCLLLIAVESTNRLDAADSPPASANSLYRPLVPDEVFAPNRSVQFSVPPNGIVDETANEVETPPSLQPAGDSLPVRRPHVTFLPGKQGRKLPSESAPIPGASGHATLPDRSHRQPAIINASQSAVWQTSSSPLAAQAPPALTDPTQTEGVVPTEDESIAKVQLLAAKIQQLQAQVDADSNLTAEQKTELSQKLKQATESAKIAEAAATTTKQHKSDVAIAPALISQLKLELAKQPVDSELQVPEVATLIQLEQRQASAEAALLELQKAVDAVATKDVTRSERKSKLPGVIEKTKQELTAAKAELAKPVPEAGTMPQVVRIEIEARVARLQAQLSLFESETQRMDARSPLLPLQNEMLQRQLASQKKIAGQWKELVTNFRKAEAERQAREAREKVRNAHPNLRVLAERNAKLAEERVRLAALIESQAKELETVKETLNEVSENFLNVKKKQKAAGLTTAIGLYLRNQRDRLPDKSDLKTIRSRTESEISRIQLATLALRDEQKAISDHNASVERMIAGVDLSATSHSEFDIRQMVDEMLTAQRGYVSNLLNDYNTYLDELNDLDFQVRQLSTQVDAYATYIDENVLWIRSTAALSSSDGALAMRSFREFLAPQRWRELADAVWQAIVHHPVFSSLAVFLCLMVVVFERRIRRKLHSLSRRFEESGDITLISPIPRPDGDSAITGASDSAMAAANVDEAERFLPTFIGLTLTVASASLWPGLLAMVSWMLATAPEATTFVQAVAGALRTTALAMWTLGVLRQLCRRNGIGETQFDWNADDLRVAHRSLSWLMTLGLPIVFAVMLINEHGEATWIDSAGRLLFITGMLVLSTRLLRAMHPQRGAVRQTLLDHPDGWLSRLKLVWYPLAVGIPLVFAALAAVGFYYTAQQLTERLITTVWLALGLILVHALVNRWAKLTEQRLQADAAAKQAESERIAVADFIEQSLDTTHELASTPANANSSSADLLVEPQQVPVINPVTENGEPLASPGVTITPEVDLDAIAPDDPVQTATRIAIHAQQIRTFTAGGLLVGFLVGCWSIWAAVLPALGILDRVELWDQVVNMTEVVDTGDGKSTTQLVVKKVPITLSHLIMSVAIIVLTIAGSRNIPGLLEVALFRRLPLDDGGRHALTTIFRYVLTLAGFVFAFRMIGITWASVQWLAAAMTVGLGFGLQEIFANFVSGLILLFERPIRIGDLVTVAGTTGSVTKMKIRATTITDFDRRELIVPNKTFITSDFVNWTLSDPVTRIVLPVGVAYGTDTQKVHDLLLKVAVGHELVMTDPSPSVLFKNFGDSNLNFDLRVFIPMRDHYVAVVNGINRQIAIEFEAAGIEIAYPQRDIHIRTLHGMEQFVSGDKQSKAA